MKKTSLLLASVFSAFILNAQTLVISNGEDTGLNWGQIGSTAVEIVDWHPQDGNGTQKAMAIWISTNSDQWSGGGLGGLNIDVNTYNTISVLVYKNVTGNVQLELQDGTNNYYLQAYYDVPGTWQKLEFTIPSEMDNIQTLLIAPFIDYDLSTITNDGGVEQSRAFWDEVEAFHKTATSVLDVNTGKEIVSTQIYSVNGNLLQTLKKGETHYQTVLPRGIYIIKSTDTDGKVINSKFTKAY